MVTFKDYANAAIALYRGSDSSFLFRMQFWIDQLGDKPLESIVRDDIESCVDALLVRKKYRVTKVGLVSTDETLSNGSVNRYVAALGTCLKILRQFRKLPRGFQSPVVGVQRLREAPGRTLVITVAQVRSLVHIARLSRQRKLAALISVGCTTGLRMANIRGLKWGDVDLATGALDVARTKSGGAMRAIIPSWAVQELARIKPVGVRSEEPVFGQIHPIKSFRAALDLAGLPRDWTLHHMRHVAASVLAQSGASTITVMQALNHKTVLMANRYAHLNTASLGAAMESAWK